MGIGIGKLLLLLAIIILLFGTKKLSSFGTDIGSALKNFKNSMKDGEDTDDPSKVEKKEGTTIEGTTIEGQVDKEKDRS